MIIWNVVMKIWNVVNKNYLRAHRLCVSLNTRRESNKEEEEDLRVCGVGEHLKGASDVARYVHHSTHPEGLGQPQ